MYTIVAGIDESEERATAQAEEILNMPIDPEDIHVTVVHAFQDNPSGASVSQVRSVRRFVELMEDAGIEVELEEAGNEAATTITEFAEKEDADLIVVAGRKRTPTGKVLFGSVTQAIILDTTRAVLVCSTPE
jgi:nucleotide-binding universal stress UspA family protein